MAQRIIEIEVKEMADAIFFVIADGMYFTIIPPLTIPRGDRPAGWEVTGTKAFNPGNRGDIFDLAYQRISGQVRVVEVDYFKTEPIGFWKFRGHGIDMPAIDGVSLRGMDESEVREALIKLTRV